MHVFNARGENIATLESLKKQIEALEQENERLKRIIKTKIATVVEPERKEGSPTLH